MLFSLRMAVLLHKWEFKNIEVEFLKVSEKIWSPGLPDIGARKSWDFLILTVSASTVKNAHLKCLTLKAVSVSVAYEILIFSEKIKLTRSFIFSKKKKKKKTPRNVFVFSALRVKPFLIYCTATAHKRMNVREFAFLFRSCKVHWQ